jgi:hypothetical protein
MSITDTNTGKPDNGLPSDILTFTGMQNEAARLGNVGDAWAAEKLTIDHMATAIISIMVAASIKGVNLESLVLAELSQRRAAVKS